MPSHRLLIVIALPVLALLGCTAPPQDTANARGSTMLPTPTTTTLSRSPRPGEVRLDGVEPCGLLTPAQRTELSLDSPPSPYVDPAFGDAKACTIRSTVSGNVARLALVTVQGVDVWLDENAGVNATALTVSGYPALTIRTPGLDTVCNVEVDVAEGQFLDVMFRDGGNATAAQQDHLCLGAQRVAEAAVINLRGGR
jgi:hypothetical protein